MSTRPRFRTDNTEGYTSAQLDELNRRYQAEIDLAVAVNGGVSLDREDWADYALMGFIAERVQADYDTELSA